MARYILSTESRTEELQVRLSSIVVYPQRQRLEGLILFLT
jgi:hypothetical protein